MAYPEPCTKTSYWCAAQYDGMTCCTVRYAAQYGMLNGTVCCPVYCHGSMVPWPHTQNLAPNLVLRSAQLQSLAIDTVRHAAQHAMQNAVQNAAPGTLKHTLQNTAAYSATHAVQHTNAAFIMQHTAQYAVQHSNQHTLRYRAKISYSMSCGTRTTNPDPDRLCVPMQCPCGCCRLSGVMSDS